MNRFPTPRKFIRGMTGSSSRLLPLAFLLILPLMWAGCLQPHAPGGSLEDSPVLEDPGRRAGSSSSTNWPPDLGGDPVEIAWRCDSSLVLAFRYLFAPVPVSGKIHFFHAGWIPALEAPKPREWEFTEMDTVTIPATLVDSLESGADTIGFSMLVKTRDGKQSFLMGFARLPREGRFSATAFPSDPPSASFFLVEPRYHFRGALAESASLLPASGREPPKMALYIPGTPYFSPVELETAIMLGPLPRGRFPLRLLRISSRDDGKPGCLAEILAVTAEKGGPEAVFRPGETIFSRRFPTVLKLGEVGSP